MRLKSYYKSYFEKLLQASNISEKLSKIYVDDNRCIVERLLKGVRYAPMEEDMAR